MNNKILSIQEAIIASAKLKLGGKKIVLAGGFFDILHLGHIKFLESAKKHGDYLFVLLEEGSKAKKIKGKDRPINSRRERAIILSALKDVDYIVLLKGMTNNDQYDKLITQIAPDTIAVTFGDSYISHKKRQAKLIGAKIMFVTKRIVRHSTTKLANTIAKLNL